MAAGESGADERDEWENGTERDDFDGIAEQPAAKGNADDDFEPVDAAASGPTLAEHLHQQLLGLRLADEDRAAVMALIESLDDDGYLADPLDQIAARVVPIALSRQHLELLARRGVKRLCVATGAHETPLLDAQALTLPCEPT